MASSTEDLWLLISMHYLSKETQRDQRSMFFEWEGSLLLEGHMLKARSDLKSKLTEMGSLSKQPCYLRVRYIGGDNRA